MAEQTGGTLTFLFSDVEDSTALLRRLGSGYSEVLARQQRLLREAFAAVGGHEIDSQGDSFFAAFQRPRDAVLAAVAAQRSLGAESWPGGAQVRVRIGIHTGPAELSGDRYVGLAVHRAARICAAGHGGQVLLSQATLTLLEDEEHELPELEFRELGTLELKDFPRPVRLFQVVAPSLADAFPPLRGDTRTGTALEPVRVSDADRDRAVVTLREHTAAGRLTLEEFSERLELAYAARTRDDLEGVTRDLPAGLPAVRKRPPRRFTVAIFSNTQTTGRWRMPRRGFAFVFFGDADIDFRSAELGAELASLTVFILFGNADVYVPEGVDVDFGGLGVVGHRREWGRDVPPLTATPLLRVHVFSLFGTADVWRVPAAWAGRAFREVINALRRGEQHALPPGGL
jgi:class 3 adenylate cyclase